MMWTAGDAAAATAGEALGDWRAKRVVIDSRGVEAGDLFVALEGPNHDGHRFVGDALAKGAAAVVARVPAGLEGAPLLVVDDTLRALTALGEAGRRRSGARVVGVTGSVGKTSVKEGLRAVLSRFGTTHAALASHNNHWGVPLTLANLDPAAAFAVVEMGMNHAGELRALTRIARPHVAVVTMVAPAHLEFFADVEAIAHAKAEVFEGLAPSGVAVVNLDAAHADVLLRAARARAGRVITYGADRAADLCLDGMADGSVAATVFGRPVRFRLGPPGRHWAINALGLLAVGEGLGLDLERVLPALADLEPPAGRGLRRAVPVGGGTVTLIDESYNANPASMAAAIDLLARTPGRRLAALGDMLELGPASPALHAALTEDLERAGTDRVFACGPMMRHLFDALPERLQGAYAADAEALVPLVLSALRPDDALLVKGSAGSRMGLLVAALTARAAA